MQYTIQITSDSLGKKLAAKIAALQNPTGLCQRYAMAMESLSKRAFKKADLRPSVWPVKADGSIRTLIDKAVMVRSPRAVHTARSAGVVSSVKYAAIHQLGGTVPPHQRTSKKGKVYTHPGAKIPAAPFMPFTKSGKPTPKLKEDLGGITDRWMKRPTP